MLVSVPSLRPVCAQLARILKHHVIEGKVMAAKAITLSGAATLSGDLRFNLNGGTLMIDDIASVIETDMLFSTGVAHVYAHSESGPFPILFMART